LPPPSTPARRRVLPQTSEPWTPPACLQPQRRSTPLCIRPPSSWREMGKRELVVDRWVISSCACKTSVLEPGSHGRTARLWYGSARCGGAWYSSESCGGGRWCGWIRREIMYRVHFGSHRSVKMYSVKDVTAKVNSTHHGTMYTVG
jgi:hypothetical protein